MTTTAGATARRGVVASMLGFGDLTNGETVQQPNQSSESHNSSRGSRAAIIHHPVEQLELRLDVFTNDH